ncbi:UDP-4-amino-4,6-dideoxy-N-acetyl-beta-L-altrosamine transaminase [Chitinibacter sp. FCG-7]|uniref:UDP-4-amino-4, 6-dideoxy-N-acetyl-beta-L-altrosamine transaminase n=1 Tax=Chitinibacter mangrovi TaxID=3153927 RepID=A0AAU7FBJ6_9NEIS
MDSYIPYGRQSINEADIAAVVRVLQSDWLTQGPMIECFENAVAQAAGAKYAVALSSATAGLHLACLALGIGPGDRVWTSPNTFVASANCAMYCGAAIDFVDIDRYTRNISIEALEQKLAQAELMGTLPTLLIPVHFAGLSCDMAAIAQLAQRYGFRVLEDAAHAIGASYQDQPVGGCHYSQATVFSFHPVKIVTTGEGGVITTNDEAFYRRLLRLRSHGITRNPDEMTQTSEGDWYYQQLELGFNYRMTDLQAALGVNQISRLKEFCSLRRDKVQYYLQKLPKDLIQLPKYSVESAWHLFCINLRNEKERKRVFDAMRLRGIGVNVHYLPVHLQPFYRNQGFNEGDFPCAESYYRSAITLPLFADLSLCNQDYVIQSLLEVLEIE